MFSLLSDVKNDIRMQNALFCGCKSTRNRQNKQKYELKKSVCLVDSKKISIFAPRNCNEVIT